MQFGELKTEFYARGFDYLALDDAGQARAERWINEAYLDLCDREPWPFLTHYVQGVNLPYGSWAASLAAVGQANGSPRTILTVTNTTTAQVLPREDERTLQERFGDLTAAGTAQWWYPLDWVPGAPMIIASYPYDTASKFTIRLLVSPGPLDADADDPVVPARFHDTIVDLAVLRAMKDSDNYEAASALQAFVETRLGTMRDVLLLRDYGTTDTILEVRGSESWGA